MENDDHPMEGAFTGPGPQDIANGTAILASALAREAESLAATAATRRRLLDALLAESLVGPESLAA